MAALKQPTPLPLLQRKLPLNRVVVVAARKGV